MWMQLPHSEGPAVFRKPGRIDLAVLCAHVFMGRLRRGLEVVEGDGQLVCAAIRCGVAFLFATEAGKLRT